MEAWTMDVERAEVRLGDGGRWIKAHLKLGVGACVWLSLLFADFACNTTQPVLLLLLFRLRGSCVRGLCRQQCSQSVAVELRIGEGEFPLWRLRSDAKEFHSGFCLAESTFGRLTARFSPVHVSTSTNIKLLGPNAVP